MDMNFLSAIRLRYGICGDIVVLFMTTGLERMWTRFLPVYKINMCRHLRPEPGKSGCRTGHRPLVNHRVRPISPSLLEEQKNVQKYQDALQLHAARN